MRARTYQEALLQGRCPCCREGKIFRYPITQVTRFSIMNERCPHCQVRLEPEPGFYQGAMYVSYGISVAFLFIISTILYLLGNPPSSVYIGSIIGVMFLVAPFNFRASRVLYLYWFGGIGR